MLCFFELSKKLMRPRRALPYAVYEICGRSSTHMISYAWYSLPWGKGDSRQMGGPWPQRLRHRAGFDPWLSDLKVSLLYLPGEASSTNQLIFFDYPGTVWNPKLMRSLSFLDPAPLLQQHVSWSPVFPLKVFFFFSGTRSGTQNLWPELYPQSFYKYFDSRPH